MSRASRRKVHFASLSLQHIRSFIYFHCSSPTNSAPQRTRCLQTHPLSFSILQGYEPSYGSIADKYNRDTEVQYITRLFLTSALDGGEWSASRPCRFTSREIPLDTRLGGPQSRFGRCGEEEILPLSGIEPWPTSP
jgi:hypothetical protein